MIELIKAIYMEVWYQAYLREFYSCPLRSKPTRKVFLKRAQTKVGFPLLSHLGP